MIGFHVQALFLSVIALKFSTVILPINMRSIIYKCKSNHVKGFLKTPQLLLIVCWIKSKYLFMAHKLLPPHWPYLRLPTLTRWAPTTLAFSPVCEESPSISWNELRVTVLCGMFDLQVFLWFDLGFGVSLSSNLSYSERPSLPIQTGHRHPLLPPLFPITFSSNLQLLIFYFPLRDRILPDWPLSSQVMAYSKCSVKICWMNERVGKFL